MVITPTSSARVPRRHSETKEFDVTVARTKDWNRLIEVTTHHTQSPPTTTRVSDLWKQKRSLTQ